MSKCTKNWAALNANERLLLSFLFLSMGPVPIADIQLAVYGAMPSGTSMARNNLRKPVALGLLERVAPGTYQITEAGVRSVPMLPMREAFTKRRGMLRARGKAERREELLRGVL